MSERANPKDAGFQDRWQLTWHRGIVPWITRSKSPYREALKWRYGVGAHVCRGKDVLDVPCGMGWGTSLLRGCRSLVGLDVSLEAIGEAKLKYAKNAHFQVGDMVALPFRPSAFDLIVCLEGIEHVPPAAGKTFIEESARVLRTNGDILVSSPRCIDSEHSGNPFHFKEYSAAELKVLLFPHFTVIKEEYRQVDNLLITLVLARKKKSAGR